uniref:Sorting nexin-25 n=1 Tax=Anopheles christyi TaxID=43041 RepID=A0A182JXB7_9DIPT
MRVQYWIGVIAAIVCAVCVYSPIFLYFLLFIIYSLVLIAVAVFGTIYVHYKLTNREPVSYVDQGQDQQANVLYNATRSPLFGNGTPGSSPTSRNLGGRSTGDAGSCGSGSGASAGQQLPIIFGRTVDGLLQQIIDNTMRDLVGPALEVVVANPRRIVELLREDIWLSIEKLHERAARIDAPKLIACDFVLKVTQHLQKIRRQANNGKREGTAAHETLGDGGEPHDFILTASYLATTEKELDFLKKISEILIIFLLPRGYSLSPVKDLLSEVIAYRVLHPAIHYLTAPDFINQQIVECIETRLVAVAIQKRSHEYAANFEDFLRIIDMTQTAEELHSIRASIVSDIRQATTMQTMQRARGGFTMSPSCDGAGSASGTGGTPENGGHGDGEPAATLRLNRYIQQLSFAKSQCEKCLTRLGWEGCVSNDVDLSLADILSTVGGRRALTTFLEPMNAASLVGYYTTVEELRRAARSAWHQLGAEIFYTYIRAPSSEIPLDKATRKRMEAFLVGDIGGPDVFYEVQRECLALLEQKYYQPFLLSDEYTRLKSSLTQDEFKEIITSGGGNGTGSLEGELLGGSLQHGSQDSQESQESGSSSVNGTDGGTDPALADLSNHSQYARNKLDRLDEKLANKQQALEALKQSLKPDSKLLLMLEREIEWLRGERRQLESHLLRTAVWGEYLGSWRAIVESVDFSDDREPPQFMIVVQVDEMNDYGGARDDSVVTTALEATDTISTGWVVVRSLAQFHALHRKLRPMCAELRQFDLPSNNAFKLFLLKNDRALLEKAKAQVQRYLSFILEDDHLNQSEVVYEFLSPSSDRLKQGVVTSNPSPSKKSSSKFSLATIFRGNSDKLEQLWNVGGGDRPIVGEHPDFTPEDADQVSLYLEGGPAGIVSSGASPPTDGSAVEPRDSIAEPLYALLGEIFDLGGVFRWLRKSLISFVQITYGQTINRQLRESITALFDEPMLHAYATTVLRSLWPGGATLQTSNGVGGLRLPPTERTEDEQEMIMNAARSLLQDNIPELLCSLIGAQNARQGALKLFEVLQNPLYNKQLFYDLLETLMLELFPEIRQLKQPGSKGNSNPVVTTATNTGGASNSTIVQPREYHHQPSGGLSSSPTYSSPTPTGAVGSASGTPIRSIS